jgi:hypothetical protein
MHCTIANPISNKGAKTMFMVIQKHCLLRLCASVDDR